jgi:predicted aspartyl protease
MAMRAIMVAALAFGASAQAAPPPPEDAEPPAAVVKAATDRHARMTVPVTIKGAGPYRFLVDTGAQATVLSARVSQALNLVPTGRATLVAMASRSSVETVPLDGLEFAGRRFDNLTAPLLHDRDIGADGIIGLDSLQDLRVIIDFRAGSLTVSEAPLGSASGYDIIVRARRKFGQMIIADARIEGIRTAVIIDTGSWHSHGNMALKDKLRAKRSDTIVSTDVAGVSLASDIALVRHIRIGTVGLSGVPVAFADSPAFAALDLADKPALILGIGNLRPFDRVAIDFANRRVLFDVPKGSDKDAFEALSALSRLSS